MAKSRAFLIVEVDQAKEWLQNELFDPTNRAQPFAQKVMTFFKALMSVAKSASVSFGAEDTGNSDAVAASVQGTFTALPSASDTITVGVIQITSKLAGSAGNLVTVAESADNFTFAGSATALSGGTGGLPTLTTASFGRS